jgi:hypothetical protein
MDIFNKINVFKFNEFEYEDHYEHNKILYIPKYNIYVYYESDKFIVYKLEDDFNQENYYNVENIVVSETFADNMMDIYIMQNEIKIISKNNKIYFDNF